MPNMEYEVHATLVPTPSPEQAADLESELAPHMFEAMTTILSPKLTNGESDFANFTGQGSVKVELTEEGEESSARASLRDSGYAPNLYYEGMIEETLEDSIEVPGGWTLSGVEVVVYPYELANEDGQNPG